MKTLIATLALVVFIGAQGFAEADTTKTAEKAVKQTRSILSPSQERLFETGRLNETMVQPIYTSVEQLIFTEMIKQTKEQD